MKRTWIKSILNFQNLTKFYGLENWKSKRLSCFEFKLSSVELIKTKN